MRQHNNFICASIDRLHKFNEYAFICRLKSSNNQLIKKIFNVYNKVKKNPDFIFLNYYNLNNDQLNSLERDSIKKYKSDHLIKYIFEDCDKKVILIKLNKDELFKINYILENEINKDKQFFNRSLILGDILKTINNDISIWDDYRLSFMNRYVGGMLTDKSDNDKYICNFLKIYRYANKQIVGKSVIDIGSCDCYFSMIVKVMNPKIDVTASDKTMDGLLSLERLCNNKKIKIDTLKLDILKSIDGKLKFDTVTSIHVLEHIHASLNFKFINNCLKLANKRVVIIVPIEKKIQIFDHKQVFDRRKMVCLADKIKLPYHIEKINDRNLAWVINKQ